MAYLKTLEDEKLFNGILWLNTKVLGLVLGLMLGLAIFILTNWIIIKGGHITTSGEYMVGPHLQLLGQLFIGYKVSFLGSFIGFAYGFVFGTLGGALVGWIYNSIVNFRNGNGFGNTTKVLQTRQTGHKV